MVDLLSNVFLDTCVLSELRRFQLLIDGNLQANSLNLLFLFYDLASHWVLHLVSEA